LNKRKETKYCNTCEHFIRQTGKWFICAIGYFHNDEPKEMNKTGRIITPRRCVEDQIEEVKKWKRSMGPHWKAQKELGKKNI
jgi:hypothetical protein